MAGQFMRNTDAFAWEMEADPRLRSTVVAVMLLERSPDWAAVQDRFDRLSRTAPMFRQRVVPTLPPAPPRWVTVTDFDLRYHVRRVVAPPPATEATVLEMAREEELADFDRARPLWQFTLVEGLQGGGAALICKLHHALMDGIGGVQIALTVFDTSPEPRDLGPMPPEPVGEETGALDGMQHWVRYDADLATRLTRSSAATAASLTAGLARRPLRTLRESVQTVGSVYRTVRPLYETASPLMRARTLQRELAVHEVPLRELKEAGHRAGGSLNDAFVAGVTGALRRYHSAHGATVGDLMVTMPISIRTAEDPTGGNRITLMRLTMPVGLEDPAERVREIHRRAERARHERSLPLTQAIAGGLNLFPRWYLGSVLRHVDFLASDVPGYPQRVYLTGAQVQRQYAFGPTIGSGVNVTLMTYVDTCALGVNADTGAIPDFEVFRRCLVEGFDEVLVLADENLPVVPEQRTKEPARRSRTTRTVARRSQPT